MTATTTVDLLRHGEPVGGRKIRGQADDPLSELGWAQMRGAVAAERPWQVVASSTLRRCAEFAREVAETLSVPLEFDARLVERGYGAWEGRTHQEIEAEHPGSFVRLREDPLSFVPPGAELLDVFRRRVLAAWTELLARHVGRRILMVGHAGTVRVIVGQVLDLPLKRIFRLEVPNARLTRIRIDHHGESVQPRLVFHAGRL